MTSRDNQVHTSQKLNIVLVFNKHRKHLKIYLHVLTCIKYNMF